MQQKFIPRNSVFADIEHLDNDGNLIYKSHNVNILQHEHQQLQFEIARVKEKLEQVKYGMHRDDSDKNLVRFAEIIKRLRELEDNLDFHKTYEQPHAQSEVVLFDNPVTYDNRIIDDSDDIEQNAKLAELQYAEQQELQVQSIQAIKTKKRGENI